MTHKEALPRSLTFYLFVRRNSHHRTIRGTLIRGSTKRVCFHAGWRSFINKRLITVTPQGSVERNPRRQTRNVYRKGQSEKPHKNARRWIRV